MSSASAAPGFDHTSIWASIRKYAKALGTKGLEATLIAWALATDPTVDNRAKATVIGALAYLGFPIDAIPDYLPVVGLTDDIAVLLAAIASVAWAVRPRHLASARDRMREWGLA